MAGAARKLVRGDPDTWVSDEFGVVSYPALLEKNMDRNPQEILIPELCFSAAGSGEMTNR
jgi:hypothetical protein